MGREKDQGEEEVGTWKGKVWSKLQNLESSLNEQILPSTWEPGIRHGSQESGFCDPSWGGCAELSALHYGMPHVASALSPQATLCSFYPYFNGMGVIHSYHGIYRKKTMRFWPILLTPLSVSLSCCLCSSVSCSCVRCVLRAALLCCALCKHRFW